MRNLTLYITIFLILAAGFSNWQYQRERKERKRLEGNQAALMEKVQRYKTKDSLNVLSVQRLQLTAKEFKEYKDFNEKLVEKLSLKVKRLQSVTSTGTVTKTEIKTGIKDSIVFRDKEKLVLDTLKCIEYLSPYLTLQGCIDSGKFEGLIESRDTIDQVVHRVPRRFLFIKYGTKGIRQEIYSRNPHTEISYSTFIELKK